MKGVRLRPCAFFIGYTLRMVTPRQPSRRRVDSSQSRAYRAASSQASSQLPWRHIALAAAALIVVLIGVVFVFSRCSHQSDSWQHLRQTIAAESARHYDFSLGFAGDICFADNYVPMEHLAELHSTNIADGIDQRYIDIMRDMDLMWVNNEFCYSDRGEPLPGKTYTFRSTPANVKYLNDLGVDIAGLANNHVFDYGEESFLDTLSTLEDAGVPYVGAGRNLNEAKAPLYLQANGFTIAYVAASSAEYDIFTPEATATSPGILWCYDDTLLLEAIREADTHADYVVVLPHWGVEHSTELEGSQIESAHAYIDAGADAVIGGHTHILQGMEYYQGKPILYSLGNFWFDDYDIDTLVAELKFTGTAESGPSANKATLDTADVKLVLHVGTQSGVYTALADTPEWRDGIYRHIEDISINVSIDENGVVHAA